MLKGNAKWYAIPWQARYWLCLMLGWFLLWPLAIGLFMKVTGLTVLDFGLLGWFFICFLPVIVGGFHLGYKEFFTHE